MKAWRSRDLYVYLLLKLKRIPEIAGLHHNIPENKANNNNAFYLERLSCHSRHCTLQKIPKKKMEGNTKFVK